MVGKNPAGAINKTTRTLQDGAPQVVSWFINPMNTIVTVVYLRATPPVRPHNFLGILKEYKFRPPLNFTFFNWEDQQGY